MKRSLVALGRLGEHVASPLAESFDVLRFSELGEQCWRRVPLAPADVDPGTANWAGVVADLEESEVSGAIQDFGRFSSGNASLVPVDAYLACPTALTTFRETLSQESGFRKIYLFLQSVKGGEVAPGIERVLRVHVLLGDRGRMIHQNGSRFLVAEAWPLKIPSRAPSQPAESTGPASRFEKVVLPSAFEAVECVVEGLRNGIAEAHRMVHIAWRSDKKIFEKQLELPLVVIRASIGDKPTDELWRERLGLLARGPEALKKLTLALGELSETEKDLDETRLEDYLRQLDPETDPSSETVEKLADTSRLVENVADIEKGLLFLPDQQSIRRDRLSDLCLRLLRILDTPLVRRNLLKSLVLFSWKSIKKDTGPTSKEAGELEILSGELRRLLPWIQGESAVLVIPEKTLAAGGSEALRTWVETVLGRACEIVPGPEGQAWLYLERTIDPFAIPVSSGENHIEKEPRPKSEGGAALTEGDGPPYHEPKPCPVCGSSEPVTECALPPDYQATGCGKKVPPLKCPRCSRLNTKAWWLCRNHGKVVLPVPIDKVRCPECILQHHRDPTQYPLSSIAMRPGYWEPLPCPNCENLRKSDPERCAYMISTKLMNYYINGINGHDSVRFREVAREAGLLDERYCPCCGTLLIPVDHRRRAA